MKNTITLNRLLLAILYCVLAISYTDAQESFSIKLSPDKVYLIKSDKEQFVNCDFYLESAVEDTLRLSKIELKIFDKNNNLLINRYVANQGISPSILTIPKRILIKNEPICIFNPFHTFSANIPIATLEFKFTFTKSDGKNKIRKNY